MISSNKWILFDFDGTLVDSLAVARRAYYSFLSDHGSTGSDSEFDELNGPALHELLEILKERYRIPHPISELITDYRSILNTLYLREVSAADGALETLGELRTRFRLGVATSNYREIVESTLKKADLYSFFSFVVTGEEVARGKPDPEIYLKALRKSGAKATEVFVVEDAPKGVEAALAAGLQVWTFEANRRYFLEEPRVSYMRFFSDLKNI